MHSILLHTLLHFVFGILSLQDPRHFVYGSDSFESQLHREITEMNHSSLSTSRTLILYNRCSSQHLRILPGREIDAKGQERDEFARLIITSKRFDGVTIQGERTGYYLCMNKKGQMIGRKRLKTGGSVTCVFTETINEVDKWTEFRPVQKTDWFIGFTREGQPKRIDRCRPGSKSVQFLKRKLPEDEVVDPNSPDLQQIMDFLERLKLDSRGNS
ncbi:fibroblast growth factor 8b-like isoform X2 [Amphiura filiformis]|uniref:fibroblast growth factor 8b-like isoform X2 n=1 Tax=Amphiura filiformis TaxID=82378 RepID=UPI003B21BC2B